MRSSFVAALWAVYGMSTVAYADDALATFTPCPACPASITPPPITITAQYQTVSTCTPQTTCSGQGSSTSCQLEPSCSTYAWVSTTVPELGGATSTLITKTDQILELSHLSTVFTSFSPCTTTAPMWNGTAALPKNQTTSCTKTNYQTLVIDISAPFDECGPLAQPGWDGSGLCNTCVPSPDEKRQVVDVHKCLDDQCVTYEETWISIKPTTTSSSLSTIPFSSTYSFSSGINTVPITATFSPAGNPAYTNPVTSTFAVTTSVPSPRVDYVATTIIITFIAGPAPAPPSTSLQAIPVVTSAFYSTNGIHTVPITRTFTPTDPGFRDRVTTTIFYIISVTDAPRTIEFTTTVTVTFTLTVYSIETVVSGSTLPASSSTSTGPASNSASSTTSISTLTTSVSPSSSAPTSSPTSPPSNPAVVGIWDFIGCLGSTQGFPTFSLSGSDSLMTIELCTSECEANGDIYSGLYTNDCYCASVLDTTADGDITSGVCDIPCPGNPLQSCGGNVATSGKHRRAVAPGILLDIYEANPTTTSASSTETSPTSSSTPDPSSDPDPEPVKRDIQADMEVAQRKARDDTKLRRGGMLRNPNHSVKGPALAKRDYGLKAPFGL